MLWVSKLGRFFLARPIDALVSRRLPEGLDIELNPVHAGMVGKPEEYPWSSTQFHLGLVTADPLVKDKTLLGLVGDWKEYLGRSDAVAQKTLLRCIRTGRPAGSDHFVKLIENLTRRDLRLRKAGRPLKVS